MSRKRFIVDETEIVYINSSIYNNTPNPIPCEYNTSFSSALLDDAGEYYLTIVRFRVPNTLPIFTFTPDTYYITLTYNNTDYQVALQMYNVDANSTSLSIHTFQQFIDIINTGFTTAFTALKTANGAAPQTEAPFMVYNHELETFSLYVQNSYLSTAMNTIGIYFNDDLYNFFYNSFKVENLGVNNANKKDYKFIVSNEKNNIPVSPANYFELKQQVSTLHQWYDLQSLLFSSSSLPVRPEFITTINSNGNSIYQPIITDFIPTLGRDRSDFIYTADPYRLVDMAGHSSIVKFDFRVLYVNKNGVTGTLMIPPKFSMSVKFAFIRKDKMQNNYI